VVGGEGGVARACPFIDHLALQLLRQIAQTWGISFFAMTRMIPETIHSSVQSTAEKRLFEVIRDAPNTDRWVCLHSLGLAHHDTKRRAEIDFVLPPKSTSSSSPITASSSSK